MNIIKTDPMIGLTEDISFAQACQEIDRYRQPGDLPARTALLKWGACLSNNDFIYEIPKKMKRHGSMESGEIEALTGYLEIAAKRANRKDCGIIGAILEEVASAIKHGWTSQLLDAITAIYEPGNGLLEEPLEEKDNYVSISTNS